MKQLILLAAQYAGVADVFHDLVPKWAFGALFSRIVGSDDSDRLSISTTVFQDWLLKEKIQMTPKVVLDFFLRSPNSEAISKAAFVEVRCNNRCLPTINTPPYPHSAN
jgi:hypothetical protein